MKKNQTGTVDIVSYRTTRRDPVYKYPIEGAISGTSISHIGMRVVFNNQELFDRYIAGNRNIPYDDKLKDPETSEKLFEVYFSFWPNAGSIGIQTTDSKLFPYEHDCDDAAMLTPVSYNPGFTRYIRPTRETVSPNFPIINYLFAHTITLPPAIILHSFRFKLALQNALKDRSENDINAIVADVERTAEKYSQLYDAWFDATVAQQNASKSIWTSAEKTKLLADKTALADTELKACSKQLKSDIRNILFAGQNISDTTFLNAIEQFITFGMPESDSITLPLVLRSQPGKDFGLELDPMLKYIKDIADNPHKYQYNLFSLNCATILLDILDKAAQSCIDKQLRKAFALPWYAYYLPFPVSPAMVMQLAAKAEKIEGIMKAKEIVPVDCSCDEPVRERSSSRISQRRQQSLVIDGPYPTLRFSSATRDTEEQTLSLTEALRLINS